jgi:hypothetical protein
MKSEIISSLFAVKYLLTQSLSEVIRGMYHLGSWMPFFKIIFVVASNATQYLRNDFILNMSNNFHFI